MIEMRMMEEAERLDWGWEASGHLQGAGKKMPGEVLAGGAWSVRRGGGSQEECYL